MKKICLFFIAFLLLFVGCTKSQDIEIKDDKDVDNTDQEVVIEDPEYISVKDGFVYNSVTALWKDVVIEEVPNKDVGGSIARVYIYTNEKSPLEDARKYFDVMLVMRSDCAEAFRKANYTNVFVHFRVRDFDGNIFFYTELTWSNSESKYSIEGFMSENIIALSDKNYVDAITIALNELS